MLSVAPTDGPDGRLQLHASTVVIAGKAALFAGPSGSGKSAAALALMARGASLLADDITWLQGTPDALIASCPPTVSGRLEARGVGILNAVPAGPAPVTLVVDMGVRETERLPPSRSVALLAHSIPLLHNSETRHFIDAILQYMLHGRAD